MRQMSKFNIDLFKDKIREELGNLNYKNVDEAIISYETILTDAMERQCPSKTKQVKSKHLESTSWYSTEASNARRMKRKAERKFKKDKTDVNKALWKTEVSKYKYVLDDLRSKYHRKQLTGKSDDPKFWYAHLDKITGNEKKVSSLPTHDDPVVLA